MDFKCNYCEISFKRNCDLVRHSLTIKCKKKKDLYNINLKSTTTISKLEKELEFYKLKEIDYENKIKNLQSKYQEKIKLLELEMSKLTQENTILKNEIKSLEKSNESFRKIVEKAATKSTNTIKNNNNYTHNNYLNYISTEPIKMSEFPKQIKQFVNCETVMYDEDEFHDHIVDNILKDKNGKDKVLCTDINRKNFTYKDETSGELISDPELERLRDQLKKGTDIRQIRRDLLEKLVIEYEENGSVGIDPYKKFSEIIQKLNFGLPFVDHVAKKTYVKRCPSIKTKNISEINNEDVNVVLQLPFTLDEVNKIEGQLSAERSISSAENNNITQIFDDIEYDEPLCGESFDEEEYQKLLEEFGK